MKEFIYKVLPNSLQGLLISLFNYSAYRGRYGGKYSAFLNKFNLNRSLSFADIKEVQEKRFVECLQHAKMHSNFYKNHNSVTLDNISTLPIITKEDLRKDINKVFTLPKSKGIVSKTGGTTGKSLEVIFTKEDMQERFAMLDDFRNRFGYKLGKRTAWFSGKNLLTVKDIKKNRFWKTDIIYKVRYYSTFHIKKDYLKHYVEDLINYQPEYFVGFPSTILEIAKYGLRNGYDYPEGVTKAVFPTAETITPEMRSHIESFFKTKMYDQYASSEGAPFIFECLNGNLHLELQSGVFEVLDDNNQPVQSGRLIVTSFTTKGTPLIRYDIGDKITLEDEDKKCNCGNNNPLVKEIQGRVDDYIFSPENGKVNLGNVSNTLKDTNGILKLQVLQNEINKIELLIVIDEAIYNKQIENKFIQNWRDRIGNSMELNITQVNDIPVEKSGKYRIVKNNIKHLID